MKRTLAAALVAVSATFAPGVPAQAQTTSFQDFDRQSDTQKGETISDALARLFNFYAERDPRRASCMGDLYTRPDSAAPDTPIRGYTLLVHEIERERQKRPVDQRDIERIIFDIVNIECRVDQ